MNNIDNIFIDFISNIEWFNNEYNRDKYHTDTFESIIDNYTETYYSYKYNDYLVWFLIRNMCDINTITLILPKLYKEKVYIDISNNIWPIHLYNNNILYIKEGIKEILEWNYILISNNKYNNMILSSKCIQYFIDLLDKYAELFKISYNKNNKLT